MQITLSREIRCDALENMEKVFTSDEEKKRPQRDSKLKIFIRMIAVSSTVDVFFYRKAF